METTQNAVCQGDSALWFIWARQCWCATSNPGGAAVRTPATHLQGDCCAQDVEAVDLEVEAGDHLGGLKGEGGGMRAVWQDHVGDPEVWLVVSNHHQVEGTCR